MILTTLIGGNRESRTLTDGTYMIGRNPSCQIQFEFPDVSERHAILTVRGNKAIVEDLHSANGTYVNGEPIRSNVYTQKGIEDVTHIFGTDALGRDQFARTWTGTRVSLYVALVAILIDTFVGMSFGLVSGYYGGKLDFFLQRIVEILSTIPTTVIVTLLIVVMKPGLTSITVALMITEWIGMSRVTRAQTLRLKEREFVLASRTLGESTFSIIFREILPNIFGQIIVMCMMTIPNAIFTEAFLAFIGLGIPAPLASLGSLISDGFKSMTMYPFLVLFPVTVLALLMLSFNLMADGLRDAFDPKMKEM